MTNEDKPKPQTTQIISKEKLQTLVLKYRDVFITRFPKLDLNVHFTSSGQPPIPEEFRTIPETMEVSGFFVKVGREYRIGVNNRLVLPAQLMTFFHEYGHAV
jgi:hypothetical protein